MINHISIRNFAIIQNTEVDFGEGLNIITGETGSGKSVVIEAISLALGSRADSAYVRHGADKAVIELAGELGEEEIVITREISSAGKNLCRLNGRLVTLSELNATCRRLADIHGQYDNQSLLNPENHIRLIDSFREDAIGPIKEDFSRAYNQYRQKKTQLDRLLSSEAENRRKLDFYRFEKAEIDGAFLLPGEDEELETRIRLLQNSEKIFAAIETAYSLLNEEDNSAMTALGSSLRALEGISSFSDELAAVTEEFSDIYYRMEDISSTLREIHEKMTFTPDELDQAIDRLNRIDNLKKKYGTSIADILAYGDRITQELEQIENFDDSKAALEKDAAAYLKEMQKQADRLTQARKTSAEQLVEAVESELRDLNFKDAKLEARFRTLETAGPDGNDLIELMISANRGEPLKPLAKIASGGEISRIMLAIKNITGTYDSIPTMIFDEIDAGISGITASIVGRKLRQIARNHQIICITHLPQIAASGDSNYRIQKESDENSTFTKVEKLSEKDTVDEIARLLGGDNITKTTRESAKELIQSAKQ